jgi:hypothetical protein
LKLDVPLQVVGFNAPEIAELEAARGHEDLAGGGLAEGATSGHIGDREQRRTSFRHAPGP